MNEEERILVVNFCKITIEKYGTVRVSWAFNETLKRKGQSSEYREISAIIIQSDKYIRDPYKSGDHVNDYEIYLNPNHELNESVKSTNSSITEMNKLLKCTNILAVIIAAATGLFIALTFFRDVSKDQQPIYIQLTLKVPQRDTQLKIPLVVPHVHAKKDSVKK